MGRHGFVSDGYERAIAGIEAEVRPEIEARYADEWNAAGIFRRRVLRRQIEKEVDRAIEARSDQAPPDGMY
ncbi:hypothetical protein Mal15_61930 [Stieleria maiorica]|uniref:Uncharacterized protein n=1 Tax=Stieleria maiorica TaxID=2795974 RepID=A0A5B9MP56_9BACT|nr:hypothetical protein [Stieleria maiorica]QEG02110.1 hypothetical protein Mal15_61930 [Stieleria maiorica]